MLRYNKSVKFINLILKSHRRLFVSSLSLAPRFIFAMFNEIEFIQHCICYHHSIDSGRNNATRKSGPFARGEETIFGISIPSLLLEQTQFL